MRVCICGVECNSKKSDQPYFHNQQVNTVHKCDGIYASV